MDTKQKADWQAEIFARVLDAVDGHRDQDIAEALHVGSGQVSNWRSRGTIPFEKIAEFARDRGLSLDHLILGRGSNEPEPQAPHLPKLIIEIGPDLNPQVRWEQTP